MFETSWRYRRAYLRDEFWMVRVVGVFVNRVWGSWGVGDGNG